MELGSEIELGTGPELVPSQPPSSLLCASSRPTVAVASPLGVAFAPNLFLGFWIQILASISSIFLLHASALADAAPVQPLDADAILVANRYVLVHVNGDANCFFNAVAIQLTWDGAQFPHGQEILGQELDQMRDGLRDRMSEFLHTGTITRAQYIVDAAAIFQGTLGVGGMPEMLIRRVMWLTPAQQMQYGFDPAAMAVYRQMGFEPMRGSPETVIRGVFELLQFLCHIPIRRALATCTLPDDLPDDLANLIADAKRKIRFGKFEDAAKCCNSKI
jgi:hypothetical protein